MKKVLFITGAGSGIGAGTVKAALAAGHQVVATSRNPEKLRNAFQGVSANMLEIVQLDVSDERQARAAVARALRKAAAIDVVLNNAGYSLIGNFEELTTAEMAHQFATNFRGVGNVTRVALPFMRERRSGHIVNMSWVAGWRACSTAALMARASSRWQAVPGRCRGSHKIRHPYYRSRAGILPYRPSERSQCEMAEPPDSRLRGGRGGCAADAVP